MVKVWCAEIECIYNSENECTATEINLSVGHLHTKHQGYAHKWECRTYQQSKEAKAIIDMLNAYFENAERRNNND